MARILITGSQGYLGRFATHVALSHGDQVMGLGRSPRRPGRFTHEVHRGTTRLPAPLPSSLTDPDTHPRYDYARVDLGAPPALVALLRRWRPDAILHLAGALRSADGPTQIATNVAGTHHLLEAIAGAGDHRPRVILGSSGSVYGDHDPHGTGFDTQTPPRPGMIYAVTKHAAEQTAGVIARRHGIPLCCARIFNLIGPGADERHAAGRFASHLADVRAGRRPPSITVGPLSAVRDYVDVRDAAATLHHLATRGDAPPPVVQVASGVPTSIRHLLDRLLHHTGLTDAVTVHIEGRADGPSRNVSSLPAARSWPPDTRHDLDDSLADLLDWHAHDVERASVAGPGASVRHGDAPLLQVEVSEHHHYAVHLQTGLFHQVAERIQSGWPDAHIALVTDRTVQRLYTHTLHEALQARGVRTSLHIMGEGETAKSFDTWRHLIGSLREAGVDRRALMVCVGGGVVSDTAGFVAASYLRGIDYALVPTTLLAQHDAAVGGKVAVNTPWAKNFVGAFHHPRKVWIDPALLSTLTPVDLASGLAESIKVGLCGEPDLLDTLEARAPGLLDGTDVTGLSEVVRRAVAHKAGLLAPDPLEHDLRRVLNLGHTFGHALEAELAYDGLRHGQAVGFGLAVSTEIARALGRLDDPTADRILALLVACGLPPTVAPSALRAALTRLDDIRLVRGRRLRMVLPTDWGTVAILDELPQRAFHDALNALARHPLTAATVAHP